MSSCFAEESNIHEASPNRLKFVFVSLLCGLGLALLPDSLQSMIRDHVRYTFRPGQELANSGVTAAKAAWKDSLDGSSTADRDEIARLKNELAKTQLESQRYQLAADQWRHRLIAQAQNGTSPFQSGNSHPLIVAQAIDARIIGQNVVSLWKANKLLNAGEKIGIAEDQWVLDNAEFKIDHGQDSGVLSGLPVFAGRCIVGRIVASGRWTSSLELISARSFRAKAVMGESIDANSRNQTIRRRELAHEYLLEGNGDGACLLTQVPITESVEVGSPVYSVSGDRAIDGQMLFGYVATAERQQGALHWNIVVRPAAQLDQLETVQVVTATLNPERTVGQR